MRPKFLKGIKLTDREKVRYADLSSNWLKVNSRLHSFTESDIRKMLVLELSTYQRLHMLHRLKRRHDRLRAVRERKEMGLPPIGELD